MFRTPLAARLLAFVALTLSLAACDSTGGDWPFPGSEIDPAAGVEVRNAAELADARAAWDAAEPNAYWLRYEESCFCAPTVYDVRVIDGVAVEGRLNGESIADVEFRPLTVDGLFAQAARAFAEADGAVSVRVLPQAPRLPVTVSIDWIAQAADDEVAYRILAFAPLVITEP